MSGREPWRRVQAWNAAHPVGTPVICWPGFRWGRGLRSSTTARAELLGGTVPAVRVAGQLHPIPLTHVQVQRARQPTLRGVLA